MTALTVDDLDNAPGGFVAFSDAGTILRVNETLKDLLGYKGDDLIGKHVETLLTVAGRIFYQTHFFPLLKLHDKADEIFFSLKTRQGDVLPFLCNARRRAENGGFANHCLLLVITERGKYEQALLLAKREAEEAVNQNQLLATATKELETYSMDLDRKVARLQQVNSDIAQFSKVVSHDIQEPIRKIALLSDRLQNYQNKVMPHPGLADLVKINSECSRLRLLVSKMEEFISLNVPTGTFSTVYLEDLVMKSFIKANAGLNATNTIFNCGPLPMVQGNIAELEILFFQLFENSIKFNPHCQALQISVEGVSVQQNSYRTVKDKFKYVDFIKITIWDNGVGFSINNQQETFRIRKKNQIEGLGFGLAFCKKIVDNHFGNISIDSSVGRGTTITIMLPVIQEMES